MAGPMLGHDAPARRRDVRRPGRPGAGRAGRRGRRLAPTSACRSARAGRAVLLPAGRRARSAPGLGVPADEVRLYLALRECAHQRLFAHVPWLRARLFGAVEDYARGIVVDPSRLEEVMRSVDPSQPRGRAGGAAVGDVRAGGHPRAEGGAGPARDVARPGRGLGRRGRDRRRARRCRARRRCARPCAARRATGGPAEQTFATLVGLELRPRRLREAADLWTELRPPAASTGATRSGRTPSCCPTADDLDDPAGFARAGRAGPVRAGRPRRRPDERRTARRRRRRRADRRREPAARARRRARAVRAGSRRRPTRPRCGRRTWTTCASTRTRPGAPRGPRTSPPARSCWTRRRPRCC